MNIILLGFEPNTLSANDLAQIQALAPDKRLLVTTDQRLIEQELDNIEIAVKSFPHDLMSKAPNLRWFQQWGAGADWLLRAPDVIQSNLIVTTGSGVHAIPITEQILSYLFAFACRLPQAIRGQVQHQ